MPAKVSATDLEALLAHPDSFALLDVREAGEYNAAHIPGASWLPRRQLEFRMHRLVPFQGAQALVYDDDGRRASLAAATLERMGYRRVALLEGGVNRWVASGHATEWGMNVPSKEFGERVEVQHQVPEMDADELHRRMQRGEKLVILDTRTPEEYRTVCIPGGRSVPGGELALRVTDILQGQENATVVVNCAGRTRSIIGARALQRMGLRNVYGLRNGTSGWALAGLELERGADRVSLPSPSPGGLAAAEAFAARVAGEDGVQYVSVMALQTLVGQAHQRPLYLIDVRTEEEYRGGHIPGFWWFPGGQAVQRADDVVAVRNGTVVFCCEGTVRSSVTASWYCQMGFPHVLAVEGGTRAWAAQGLPLEEGVPGEAPFGLAEARGTVRSITPQALQARLRGRKAKPAVIFVDTSREFSLGHVPAARWVPRGWLELRIHAVAPPGDAPVVVTCEDGVSSTLAGATLAELGYREVSVLEGGMQAWRGAGLAVEQGLAGVMGPPDDVVPSGAGRSYAEMMNYLRWEEALGQKYQGAGPDAPR
jgi:rhodanese-related sulfurtransferase